MSHTDELARLAELHRNGDLTDDEFTAAKKGLLGATNPNSPPANEKLLDFDTLASPPKKTKSASTAAEEKLPEAKSYDLVIDESKNGFWSRSVNRWTIVIAGLIVVASIALRGRLDNSNSSKIQSSDTVSKTSAASALAPSYQIISENETVIGTLDQGDVGVELSRRLSDDEITIIAKQIRQDKSRYKSLHVTFWLKGMSKSALAPSYATAIFEPDLKVERRGSTDGEQLQAALVAKHNIEGKVIGAWHEGQYLPCTYVFFESNGKSYEREIFESGLIGQDSSAPNILILRYSSTDRKSTNIDTIEDEELIKRKVHGSMRFYEKDGHPDEYDVINKDDNLDFYDDEGYLTTGIKIQ